MEKTNSAKSQNPGPRPKWLNLRLNAALGTRDNLFNIKDDELTIHQQAGSTICCHSLELLISLAKSFPLHFLPIKNTPERQLARKKMKEAIQAKKLANGPTPDRNLTKIEKNDFFLILLKIDETIGRRSFDDTLQPINDEDLENDENFIDSSFGQLIKMLSFNVIKISSSLTDKLLRLLSLISVGLPDEIPCDLPTPEDVMQQINDLLKNLISPEEILTKTLNFGIEQQLLITIDVLTSKSCSEEGLEDATTLLLNLSQYSLNTRSIILTLLIKGSKDLAQIVEKQIFDLFKVLKALNLAKKKLDAAKEPNFEQIEQKRGGILKNRFTKEDVIVTAPTNIKKNCDLQLTEMQPLISKTSSQSFLLRILKVIITIREAVIETVKKENYRITEENSIAQELIETQNSELEKSKIKLKIRQQIPQPHDLLPLAKILNLENFWQILSDCLEQLELTPDHHAVLVLQSAVESFFLVHSSSMPKIYRSEDAEPLNEIIETQPVSPIHQPSTSAAADAAATTTSHLGTAKIDEKKFLKFAEKHRTVLNQILRQSTGHLSEGPFGCLVNHTRVLDFDVKRRFFRTELERNDEGIHREELAVHVHRRTVFEDSFRELYRRSPEEWKNRFYIVFEDEEGQDAGGLLREWYVIISREIFNPMYALFTVSPGDRVTYMINASSHANPNHLCYYKFVGRVIGEFFFIDFIFYYFFLV